MLDARTDAEFFNVTFDLTPREIAHPLAPLDLPTKPSMAQIQRLQEAIAQGAAGPLIGLDEGLAHYFAPGMYGRELAIPGGTVVVGKIHRHAHLVQLLAGEATVYTDKGMERITGPKTWVSPAGVKRALFTHTDCLFFTVHVNANDTQDLEAIEADVIIPEPRIGFEKPRLAEFADALQGVYA